jgi:hypothetical protein
MQPKLHCPNFFIDSFLSYLIKGQCDSKLAVVLPVEIFDSPMVSGGMFTKKEVRRVQGSILRSLGYEPNGLTTFPTRLELMSFCQHCLD